MVSTFSQMEMKYLRRVLGNITRSRNGRIREEIKLKKIILEEVEE